MKTKKWSFYAALAAVLFIGAILVTNCIEPVNSGNLAHGSGGEYAFENYVPASGNGYIRFQLADTRGRNILPDITDTSSFSGFSLLVYGDHPTVPGTFEAGQNTLIDTIAIPNLTTPVEIATGSYFFDLLAFHDGRTGAAVAASGMSTLQAIADGAGNTVSITLVNRGVTNLNLGTGSVAFTFNYPGQTLLTPTIDFISLSSGTNVTGVTLPASGAAGTQELTAGYWRVEVNMAATNRASAQYVEILHIWENVTSRATRALPTLRVNAYTVTFNYLEGPLSEGTENGIFPIDNVGHASTLSALLGGAGATHNAPAAIGSRAWVGWHFDETGLEAAPGSHQFIRAINLYSKWAAATSFTFAITYDDIPSDANAPVIGLSGTPEITFDQDSEPELTFIITNTPSNYDNFRWTIDGEEASTTNTLVMNFANIDYKMVGTYNIRLQATHTESGFPFNSGILTITVTEVTAP